MFAMMPLFRSGLLIDEGKFHQKLVLINIIDKIIDIHSCLSFERDP